MFPSFKSKADREQKQLDLLARAQRRSKQTDAKRALYEVTIWALEGDESVSVTKAIESDTSVQTQLNPVKKVIQSQM
jgi:hypothetical protein